MRWTRCPHCKDYAEVLFNGLGCTNEKCRWFSAAAFKAWVDEEFPRIATARWTVGTDGMVTVTGLGAS